MITAIMLPTDTSERLVIQPTRLDSGLVGLVYMETYKSGVGDIRYWSLIVLTVSSNLITC